MIQRISTAINDFFFRRISASGFGLMRISWGVSALLFMLIQYKDVVRYYSRDAGLITHELQQYAFRSEWRLTLFDWFTSPTEAWIIYALFFVFAFLMTLGIWARFTTIVSVLLLWSFQEGNLFPLTGGDTVLRAVGLILMVAPEIHAFSVGRLRAQWKNWKQAGVLLPPLTMSIWPYRLILWQIIIIYVTSATDKIEGQMWMAGTVVASVIHHPHFAYWPPYLMDYLTPLSPVLTYSTLIWEFAWLLLLIPAGLRSFMKIRLLPNLKRTLLLGGFLFHGSIFLLMDVGSFCFAMFTLYMGAFLGEDYDALRGILNRKKKGAIAVLYDGNCGMCQQTVFGLSICDFLKRLNFVNYHDAQARNTVAPDLQLEDLDRAMHIRAPNGRTEKGFDAFRYLNWHMPVTWLIAPIFYFPGIAWIGRKIYGHIAARREKCTHEKCGI